MTETQKDLNDLIGAFRLAGKLRSRELLDGALRAAHAPNALSLIAHLLEDDQSEISELIVRIGYNRQIEDWDGVRRHVDRMDGLFTTVETNVK